MSQPKNLRNMISLKHPWLELQLYLLMTSILSLYLSTVALEEQTKPVAGAGHCSSTSSSTSTCGNLKIPYPFGCKKGFEITCNNSETPPKAYLGSTKYEVVNILLSENRVRIRNSVPESVAHACWKLNGTSQISSSVINLTSTPFLLSPQTKFTVTGCNALGLFGLGSMKISGGCISVCHKKRSDKTNGSCSGLGCCHVSIPMHVKKVAITVENILFDEKEVREVLNETDMNKAPYLCGSAFMAEQENYKFEASDLDDDDKLSGKIQHSTVLLDWFVGNQSCKEARESPSTYACLENSHCTEVQSGEGDRGYRCICNRGYGGNPYLSHGCLGVD